MIKPCPIKMIESDEFPDNFHLYVGEKDWPLAGPLPPDLSAPFLELIQAWAQRSTWISIKEKLPPEDIAVWFWLVPKEPHECPVDSSGNPIYSDFAPYKEICKWKCWGGLSKPTHWQPLPPPPEE